VKIGTIKRIIREELQGKGDLPGWIDPFLITLNQFISVIGEAIQGKLTFEDNFQCRKVVLKFTSGTAQKLPSTGSLRIIGAIPTYFGGNTLDKWKLSQNSDGSTSITLTTVETGDFTGTVYLLLG
jgi:hypothetical protein